MNKHALIVGIDQYGPETGVRPLHYSTEDARELQRVLEDVCGFNVRILADQEATPQTVARTIQSLRQRVKAGDLLLFAFFGHGAVIGSNRQVFIPFGADPTLRTSLIRLDDLIADLRGLRPRDLVIIVDACRDEMSAMSNRQSGLSARDVELRLEDDAAVNGMVIYSCAEGEKTYESKEYEQGVFTKHLIDGIENQVGDARRGISGWRDGKLDCEYLAEQARNAVVAERGSQQNPVIERAREPIILARQGEDQGDWGQGQERDPDEDQASPRRHQRSDRTSGRTLSLLVGALAVLVVAGVFLMGSNPGARPPETEVRCPPVHPRQ